MAVDKNLQKVAIDEGLSLGSKWAREATLEKILSESTESTEYLKLLLEKFMPDGVKDAQQATKDRKKFYKDNKEGFKNLDVNLKSNFTKVDNSLYSTFKNIQESITTITRVGIVGILEDTALHYKNVVSELAKDAEGLAGVFLKIAPIFLEFGAIAFAGYENIKELNNEFNKLYETGINFNDGLAGLAKASADIGISTADLTKSFNEFSGTITLLGTDKATKLTKQFVDLNRASGTLGLTNEDATDAVLQYTDMLRVTGQLTGKSNSQLVKETSDYVTELNQLTSVTGKSRKEQQKEIEDRRKNLDLNLAIARFSPEIQKNILAATDKLGVLGPTMANAFTNGLSSVLSGKGLAGLDNVTRTLILQSGLEPVLEKMAQDAKTTGDISSDVNDALSVISKSDFAAKFGNLEGLSTDTANAVKEFIKGLQESRTAQQKLADFNAEVEKQTNERYKIEGANLTKEQFREKIRDELEKKAADDLKARNAEEQKIQSALDKTVNLLKGSFDKLLVEVIEPLLPKLTFGINVLIEVIGLVVRSFDDITMAIDMLGKIFYTTTASVIMGIGKLATGLYNLVDSVVPLTTIFTGFGKTVTFVTEKLGEFIKWIGSWIPGLSGNNTEKSDNKETKQPVTGSEIVTRTVLASAIAYVVNKRLSNMFGKILNVGGKEDLLENTNKGLFSRIFSKGPKPFSMLRGPKPFSLPGAINETEELTMSSKGTAGIISKASSSIAGALKGFGSLIKDAVVGVTDTLGQASEGLKKLIVNLAGGLGEGVGKLFQGLMEGLAKGLKVMADPLILEGAGILASTIAVVGAGIAGATWITGAALPKFAEGLKSFDDVKGENLKSVGLGMVEIGAGLLAIGAGEVVNAFGNAVSKIFNFFTGGDSDPINRLKRFETLVEPLSKAAPALAMFSSAFKTAMDLLTSANINTDSIVKTITDLTSILYTDNKSGFFSGKISTVSKIKELADGLGSIDISGTISKIIPSLNVLADSFTNTIGLLSKAAPALTQFSSSFQSSITALNSAKLDLSIEQTMADLSNILYMNKQDGLFSGKISTASKIQELAASIGELASKTAELNNPVTLTTSKGGAKLLSPSDLQKRTIDFYDNQKQSNAALIQLLQMVNDKLDKLDNTVDNGSDHIIDAVRKASGKVY